MDALSPERSMETSLTKKQQYWSNKLQLAGHTIICAVWFHFLVRDRIGWHPIAVTAREKIC